VLEIPSKHTDYRADIDGLRAVAILSVLAFHAWPTVLPGGFVGVDIFFVISGFLISRIIFRDVQKGHFSFKVFYSKRIRRIFPALAFLLTASLVIGWFTLLPDEYKMLGKHVASGTVFISNFTLLKESGYFDPAAELKPLLHLWSLAIEEQFYIIWPFLIYLAARFRMNLLKVIIFLMVASFVSNIWRIDAHLIQTFYHPLTRFWELMMGSVLAYISLYSRQKFRQFQEKFANVSAITGGGLIVVALFLLNDSKLFPGVWAVLPTLGAVLLIASGPTSWINMRIMSLRSLVFVGLISYPLYLWHWVLLSILRIVESGNPPGSFVAISLLLSFFLAWFTYAVLEKRLRYRPSSWIVISLILAVAIPGFIGKIIYANDGLASRDTITSNGEYQKQMTRDTPTDSDCSEYAGGGERLFYYCRANNLQAKKWVAIIGDSHAHVLFSGFSEEFSKQGFGTILLANSGCPPFIGTFTGRTNSERNNCADKIDQILRIVTQEGRIKKILIATRGPIYIQGSGFGPAEKRDINPRIRSRSPQEKTVSSHRIYFQGLKETINHFLTLGKAISYFLENPELGVLPKNCIGRPFTFTGNHPDCSVELKVYKSRMFEYRVGISEIKNDVPDLLILDPEPLFCNQKSCRGILNNKLLYADDDHFSIEGSRYVGSHLAKLLFIE